MAGTAIHKDNFRICTGLRGFRNFRRVGAGGRVRDSSKVSLSTLHGQPINDKASCTTGF